jgi:hypothetical protein
MNSAFVRKIILLSTYHLCAKPGRDWLDTIIKQSLLWLFDIKRLEKEIHEELSSVHEHQEFFSDGPEVEAVINRLDRQFHPERFQAEIPEMSRA